MSSFSSSAEHHRQSRVYASQSPVRCAVLTVSDTRTRETDIGGGIIDKLLNEAGYSLGDRSIVQDEPAAIAAHIEKWIADRSIHAILITGGTGIARRDTTIEVVRHFLSVEIEGFGELFRMLSYEQVNAAAMLSRAVAGLVIREGDNGGDTFVFAMPGSPNAVEVAMNKLIVPQLKHLVWERMK